MQVASPAHGRARAAVQRADTMSHFVMRPHPIARLRTRTWPQLMAAGIVSGLSGYIATAAIIPQACTVHPVALATRGDRAAPELMLPDGEARAPLPLSAAAVHEPKVSTTQPGAPIVRRSPKPRSRKQAAPALELPASPPDVPAVEIPADPPPSAAPAKLPIRIDPPPSAAAAAPVVSRSPPPSTATLALQHLEPHVKNLVVRGSLPSALIRHALARLQPAFASCQNARADVASVLASSWHTHTAIDETGRTRDLEVTGPDTARAVSSCLAHAAARLVVAPPDTGRVDASWDLRFEPPH